MYICIHGYLRNTLSIPLSFNKAPPSDETMFESLAKQNKNSFLTSCYHLKVNKQQLAYKMLNNISTNVRVIVAASRELSSGIMTF